VNDRELFERQMRSLYASARTFGQTSPGARAVELGGVLACVVPASPDRSVLNGVVYRDVDALVAAYRKLGETYAEAGIRAWTVWAPEGDLGAARLLEGAGHKLDALPMAMGIEVDDFPEQPPEDSFRRTDDLAALGPLNDAAYGVPGFSAALRHQPPDNDLPVYLAPAEGEPKACLATVDHDGDCLIAWVATLPEARGQGLATLLMKAALADARERGCTTSTLQSTDAGYPIYVRLGYRDLGRLQMWERRVPTPRVGGEDGYDGGVTSSTTS
jgi:GNAT superfamily N-acetyltransferase